MPGLTARELTSLLEEGAKVRAPFEPILSQVFSFTLPMRPSFHSTHLSGGENMEIPQDSRPINNAMATASRLMQGLMPPFAPWFEFDSDVTGAREQKKLNDGLKTVFRSLNNSNFAVPLMPFALDLCASLGVLLVDPIPGRNGIGFTNVPLSRTLVLQGPWHSIRAAAFGPYTETASTLRAKYPKAEIPPWALVQKPDRSIYVYDICVQDYSDPATEAWDRYFVAMREDAPGTQTIEGGDSAIIFETRDEGPGSCPFVSGRWLISSLNPWGMGPFVFTLPDARTLNLALDLIFKNAEMAILGIHQYEADSLNAHNIQLVAGELIPFKKGSEGLRPVEAPARFDIAQFVVQDQRDSISEGMHSPNLGPLAQTPRSATEIVERIETTQQITIPLAGMISGTALALAKRIIHLNVKMGRLPKEFTQPDIRAISPLARALEHQNAGEMQQFFELLNAFLPAEVWLPHIKERETIEKLGELFGQSAQIASEDETRQRLQNVAAAEQAQPLAAVGNA